MLLDNIEANLPAILNDKLSYSPLKLNKSYFANVPFLIVSIL